MSVGEFWTENCVIMHRKIPPILLFSPPVGETSPPSCKTWRNPREEQLLTLVQQEEMHPRILPASVVKAAMRAKMAIAHNKATIDFKVSHVSTEKKR